VHVHEGVSEDEFVAMRYERDAKLAAPLLLLPSIQVNISRRQVSAGRGQWRALPEGTGEAGVVAERVLLRGVLAR
jgi:hypothetical protein